MTLSRRKFLKTGAATAAGLALWKTGENAAPSAPINTPLNTRNTPAEVVKMAVFPFDPSQVRLLDGPFLSAQELSAGYLLSLEPDCLLHNFRVNAGLPTDPKHYGGWEGPNGELRGHFVGHYLSACALMSRSAGDARFRQRTEYIVADLAKCQQALGGGYLSAFPTSLFDRVEAGTKVWAPYYTVHKIMAGLFDVYNLCGNAQALDILKGMSAYFYQRNAKLSDDQMQTVMKNEFGGMMETAANLYAVTGNPHDLALAQRFDDHRVFDPLAARQDKLAGLHANTQIPKMIGAERLYELTGEERYHTIAGYFWDAVTGAHSFVSGGNSVSESFVAPGLEATRLAPDTSETCNTYNMLKLTRHLFLAQPDARYADFYERALYNHILGSIDPDSGTTTYYYSLKPGHFKVYGTPIDSFWCCTGTGVENHAKHNDSIYFHDADALWVNLFLASEVRWPEKGVTLRQETAFPEQPGTKLTFHCAKPVPLALKLRVPGWATNGVSVKINGQAQTVSASPQSYLTLARTWKSGDVVEYTLPMSLHLYHPSDDPQSVAILYGPVVLAGDLGHDNMPPSDHAKGQHDLDHWPNPAVPVLTIPDSSLSAWIKPVLGKPLTFQTVGAGQPSDVTLVPLYQVHHERYTVYWKTSKKENIDDTLTS